MKKKRRNGKQNRGKMSESEKEKKGGQGKVKIRKSGKGNQ